MAADAAREVLIRARVFRGAASNMAGQAIVVLTAFVLTPYILEQIGPTGYGLWVLVGSLAAYGDLFDLGISSGVVKYVAQYRAQGDRPAERAVLASALRLYAGLGLLAIAVSIVIAPLVPRIFNVPSEDRSTASLLVVLAGLNLAVSIVSAPALSILTALQRFGLSNLVRTGALLLSAIATVIVLEAGGGVVGMVAVTIPVTLLMRFVCIRLIRVSAPDLAFGYRGASRAATRQLLTFGGGIFASQISDLLQRKSDELVVALSLSVSAVTPYALGRRVSELPHLVTNQFVRVLLPIAAEMHAIQDVDRLRTLYVVASRVTIAIFTPIGLSVALLAQQIIDVWVHSGYEEAVPIVVILTMASYLVTSQWPAGAILQGMGKIRLIALSSVASGIANVALSIVLVQRLGLIGVAIGTLLPSAVEAIGVVLPYAMVTLRVPIRTALVEIWLPALLPALPAGFIILALREAFAPTSVLGLAFVMLAGASVYLGGYLIVPATVIERGMVIDAIRKAASAAGHGA
jgi:O-antigen/teichoic acid export membrane protein